MVHFVGVRNPTVVCSHFHAFRFHWICFNRFDNKAMSNLSKLVLCIVQIVNNGKECREYKQWSNFFHAQEKAAKGEGVKTKLQELFGIRDRADTSFMVGLSSAIQILKEYQYIRDQKRLDFSDIYVVYANRGEIVTTVDLCESVEMSFLAVTSANVPVVLHMGINRTSLFCSTTTVKR